MEDNRMNNKIEVLPSGYINPQIVETKKGKVEYHLSEGDGPVVLVFHGGLGGFDQARAMSDWIDETKFRILCPSRPGYLGTPLESGKTIEQQCDLFAALLDSLNIDKIAVVTASAGGPPGYDFAIRHPDKTWALIAIDSVSGYYDMPETAGAIAQAIFLTSFGQKILKKIEEKKPDLFLKQIYQAEAYFTKQQTKEHIDYVLNSPKALAFMNIFMNTMYPYKPRKSGTENDMEQYRQLTHLNVEKIKCPSLIIHGTHDSDVKFYDGVYAYEHIPHCERYWIEEGSHLGFWLSPHAQDAQKAAVEFLEKYRPNETIN